MHEIGNPRAAAQESSGLRSAWLRLTGSGLALLAGATAEVEADAARWFGVRGPHCPLGTCLGEHACPGCGLVRGVAATLQGRFGDALTFHPGAPAVALLLLGTFAAHLHIVRAGRESPGHRRLLRVGHLAFATVVLAGWTLRLLAPSLCP